MQKPIIGSNKSKTFFLSFISSFPNLVQLPTQHTWSCYQTQDFDNSCIGLLRSFFINPENCWLQITKSCTNQTTLYSQATHIQQYSVWNLDSLLKNKERKGFVYAVTRCIISFCFTNCFTIFPVIDCTLIYRTSHSDL